MRTMRSQTRRDAIKGVVTLTLPSLAICLVILELVFTYVLPGSQSPYADFDRASGILHFDTDGPRTGVHTTGNLAQQRGRWSVNNFGWNSPIDYQVPSQRSTKPLVALIGDSYIEAFSVDNDKDIASDLRRLTEDRVDVYSFGISGAPLSQYLQMSRYVRDHFDPDVFVVNVVHNDFDESIRAYKSTPYFMQFELAPGQVHELPPEPYVPVWWRRTLGKSAIVRFLHQNANVNNLLRRLNVDESTQFDMNVDVGLISDRMAEIRVVTEYVVRTLMDESQERPVVFLLDAPRQQIYENRIDPAFPPEIHVMFGEVCELTGAICLDLLEEFVDRFEETGTRFNTEYDGHWNEVGHEVAAEALFTLLDGRGLIPSE